jgi:putative mRNA 3-end processing factor
VNGDIIDLVPSNHMLGSVQVKVTCADGYRVGYSSDFFWPIDDVIEVDELIVDATYGDPLRTRKYTQQCADEQLINRIVANTKARKPTAIIGHNGRLHYAMHLAGHFIDCPVLCSPKVHPLVDVYRQHGFNMPDVLCTDGSDAISILRRREPCVAFVALTEQRHHPWVERLAKIVLSAHMSRPNDPVTLYDNGDCCIAMTDHADFRGTLEYIRATGAKIVWTDPRTGNAEALADAVANQLGITSRIVPEIKSLGWG